MIFTFSYKVKHTTTGKHLASLACWVNTFWNYCGEIQEAARRHNKRRPIAFDLIKLTTGSRETARLPQRHGKRCASSSYRAAMHTANGPSGAERKRSAGRRSRRRAPLTSTAMLSPTWGAFNYPQVVVFG